MKSRLRLVLWLAACGLVLGVSACGPLLNSSKPEPATQVALIRVTDRYLNFILNAQDKELDSMVLWKDYLSALPKPVPKEEILSQIHLMKDAWTPEEHPLRNLDLVKEISVDGDTAQLQLRRIDQPTAPVVKITLVWVGRGWLIDKDNILGPGGIFAALEQKQAGTVR